MKYALLVYGNTDVVEQTPQVERDRISAEVDELVSQPNVTGWLRLHNAEAATTVRLEQGSTLLTDGPFVDSKEFLGGFIVVEAENLDDVLAIARDLQLLRLGGGIEIRPVREEGHVGA